MCHLRNWMRNIHRFLLLHHMSNSRCWLGTDSCSTELMFMRIWVDMHWQEHHNLHTSNCMYFWKDLYCKLDHSSNSLWTRIWLFYYLRLARVDWFQILPHWWFLFDWWNVFGIVLGFIHSLKWYLLKVGSLQYHSKLFHLKLWLKEP